MINSNHRSSLIQSKHSIQSPPAKGPPRIKKIIKSPKKQDIQKLQQIKLVSSLERIDPSQNNIKNQEHIQYKYDNGDIYNGPILNYQPHGRDGTYIFSEKNVVYKGDFENGYFHGRGNLFKTGKQNEPFFQGSWIHGQKNGEGKYLFEGQKHYYQGNFANDRKNGKGVYKNNDFTYTGDWIDNLKHGKGKLIFRNGTQYIGTFRNNQFTEGQIKYPNKDIYDGECKKGKREGQGEYFYANTSQTYVGRWREDLKHGKGILMLKNGDRLECEWVMGKIEEKIPISYQWNDGTKFTGKIRNGITTQGRVIQIDGQTYTF